MVLRARNTVAAARGRVDPAELRRLAAGRRLAGDRLRRVLPGVIIGSTTLLGSGLLAAWVGGQPGMGSASHPVPRSGHGVTGPTATTDPVPALNDALRADEAALRSLESGLPVVGPAPSLAGSRTGGGVPGAGSVTLPSIAPLPQIAVPVAPAAVSPAPVVNATTGASHAIP